MTNKKEDNQSALPSYGKLRLGLARFAARLRRAAFFLGGVLAALLAIVLYNLIFPAPQPLTDEQVDEVVAQALASATPRPAYSAQVYNIVQPSLVLIQARGPDNNDNGADGDVPEHDGSLGSGVIINQQGDILTSLHVVDGASEIKLLFADGTESAGQVIAAQPENDIAVLAAETPPLLIVPAMLGNPNAMNVGDEVFAVGNPFGLYSSISAGVISGFERSFMPPDTDYKLEQLIQFDAAVNPGNSGGPLLNRSGQVVGIVVGIVNPTEGEFFIGIGFAVPITIAGGAAGMPSY